MVGIHQICTELNESELLLKSDRMGIRFSQATVSQLSFSSVPHCSAVSASGFLFVFVFCSLFCLKEINLTHYGAGGYCKWISDGFLENSYWVPSYSNFTVDCICLT